MFKNKLNTTNSIFILTYILLFFIISCNNKKETEVSKLVLKTNNSLEKKDSSLVNKGLKNKYGFNFNKLLTNKAFSMNISNEFVMNYTPDETSFSIYDSTKVNDTNRITGKISSKNRGYYRITISILDNKSKISIDSLVKINIVNHNNVQPKIDIRNVHCYRFDEKLEYDDLSLSKKQFFIMKENSIDKLFIITIFSNFQTETDIDEYLQEAIKSIKLK